MNPLARSLAATLVFATFARGGVDVKELPDRVRIEIGGQLFTEYVHEGATHVYFWPLLGPGGAKMTRAWPMAEVEGEDRDHPHHRSLWYAHGEVNGVDFWSESASYGTKPPPHPVGRIAHDKIIEAKGGAESGVLKAAQKWIAPDGSVPVTSVQTLRLYAGPENERMFDFEITLTAGAKDAVFGDTKEGTAAIRIAESMRLKQPKGPGEGHIVNSEGETEDKVWGKRAKWVDMSGPIDGKVFGIAFMDHPSNPRHPTRWHARDYGLFAANPFCEVEMDKNQPKGAGDFTLKAGKTVTFRYRILIHENDAATAKVADRFTDFAAK